MTAAFILCCFAFVFSPAVTYAAPFDKIMNRQGAVERIDSTADSYEYIGSNVIARGHVVIHFGTALLTADKAIFNLDAQDVDLSGNVTYTVRVTNPGRLSPKEYDKAVRDPYRIIRKTGAGVDDNGKPYISVSTTKTSTYLKAERAFFNMKSGAILFKDFTLKEGVLYATGARAERRNDGSFNLRDVRFSTCNYLIDDHDHYALSAKKAMILPSRSKSGIFNFKADKGDSTILTQHTFLELWGVPVFWFPALYKAPEDGGFGGRIEIGDGGNDWGFYVKLSKNFHILDEPYLNVNVLADFYEWRGFGYGTMVDFVTPESSTDLFFYGIRDKRPYRSFDHKHNLTGDWQINDSRLAIPKNRYEFKLSNVTHITNRLDFRGQIDVISDYNFLNDFFSNRYRSELEPPTFLSLEQQFDRFTASIYSTLRVNDFYTTVERLPEMRLDFQRQELFANLYYQGETTGGYYRTKWRDFDRDTIYGNRKTPKDYDAFRFDSLHMFYYPIKLFNINIIPRAGMRFTAYSQTSKKSITSTDLTDMFRANAVDGQPNVFVKNYDDDGGAKFRFAGELGVEVNTKFYRTWQDLKSEFFGLDGLRHVVVPYVNYTFIPKPTESAKHLYYFDEIDRISKTNFVRLGLVNRLQTRRGNNVYEWFSLETYWDCFVYKAEGFNHIGDFGTILRFRPTQDLTLSVAALFDLGQTNDHDSLPQRGNRYADDRPGVSRWKYLNRLEANFSWKFAPDWRIYMGYSYNDDYVQRSAFSMGSTLSAVNATSLFYTAYERGQDFTGGLEFPTYIDPKLTGYIRFDYDVDAAIMRDVALGFKRNFHCWLVQFEFGRKGERGGKRNNKRYDNYFAVFASLTAMPGIQFGQNNQDD